MGMQMMMCNQMMGNRMMGNQMMGMGSDQADMAQMMETMGGGGKGCKGFGKGKTQKDKTPGSMTDASKDMTGKPGPNGEDPSTGRWVWQSTGAGTAKKWKWRNHEKRAAQKEVWKAKRVKKMAEEGASIDTPNVQIS